MKLELALEQLRFVIFKGILPDESRTHDYTQEQYVLEYEQQIERDPAKERRLFETYSLPILPIYRKQMEQLSKMEQLISESSVPISFSDEEVLDELYDELSNLETEIEWQDFKKRLLEI